MGAPRPGRPEAAATAWERVDQMDAPESPAKVRRKGALQAAGGVVVGGVLYGYFGLTTLPYMMFAAASVLLLSSLLSPGGVYRALESFLGAIASRLGRGVMWVALASIFYLFFMPFSLLFRRGRRDRLARSFEPEAESYWNWEPSEGSRAASTSLETQY
jgi:hypothetical protein